MIVGARLALDEEVVQLLSCLQAGSHNKSTSAFNQAYVSVSLFSLCFADATHQEVS